MRGLLRRALPALLFLLSAALLCAWGLALCGRSGSTLPMGDRLLNLEQMVSALRRGLRDHASTVTLRFDYGSDVYAELGEAVGSWFEAALAETEDPAEGDYIRYQIGGYDYSVSRIERNGRWTYEVILSPRYYCYASQERQVAEKVAALLEDFAFTREDGEAARIGAIYDYLCRNVTYDKIHRKNPHFHLRSTAYWALLRGTATCQGYCAALYRLLREAGIDCRIVTGSAAGEEGLHAWVIARVEGLYYALDPTWDAGQEAYRYFLAGTEAIGDRRPEARFLSEDFTARYPMAEKSYAGG